MGDELLTPGSFADLPAHFYYKKKDSLTCWQHPMHHTGHGFTTHPTETSLEVFPRPKNHRRPEWGLTHATYWATEARLEPQPINLPQITVVIQILYHYQRFFSNNVQ